MSRLLTSLLLGLTLATLPACGGDDDGGGDGSDGPDDIDAGDGDDIDASTGPDAPTPDAFVPPTAADFCADWAATCTFVDDEGAAGNYENEEDCLTKYEDYDDGQKKCVFDHWVLAEAAADDSPAEDDHCGHSSGNPPCN